MGSLAALKYPHTAAEERSSVVFRYRSEPMSPHSFVVVLVFASALLAFWVGARFPAFGPHRFAYAVLHLFCGLAAVRAIPGLTNAALGMSAEVAKYLVPFGVALPLFTYAFLTGLWLLRLIHRTASGHPY
jgi:hypothetical protein